MARATGNEVLEAGNTTETKELVRDLVVATSPASLQTPAGAYNVVHGDKPASRLLSKVCAELLQPTGREVTETAGRASAIDEERRSIVVDNARLIVAAPSGWQNHVAERYKATTWQRNLPV